MLKTVPSALCLAATSFACTPGAPAAAPGSPAGSAPSAAAAAPAPALLARAQGQFERLPAPETSDPRLVALGRRLFFETGASADGKVGCVSCHLAEKWGSDGLPLASGVFGRVNPRNAPTVFNAGGQFAQHWRGDRESLEDQATRALLGPASFGNASEAEATERLKRLADADAEFAAAFPSDPAPITMTHWGQAIAAYEQTLATPAPFDAWLGGDDVALSADAQRGLSLFLEVGCPECHDGALLGGGELAKFGRQAEYWTRTHSAKIDAGRFDVTHAEADRYVFKVAALRNVAKTGPYFHDGSVASLPEAVSIMADVQLGRTLEPKEQEDIVAFLETLTGPIPAGFSPPAKAE